MYKKILIPLDSTATDRAIIEHIKQLAAQMKSRVVLLHVATGTAAQFHGSDAGGQEVAQGRRYVESVRTEFESSGISAEAIVACGDPATEILRWANQNGCDLIAMSTHGHGFVRDLVYGTTANRVQHNISVPVLLLRAK